MSGDFKRKRSRVLYQITAMIIVVFVATGLASFFFFRSSQNRLVEKSVNKLIETEAESFAGTFEVVNGFVSPEYKARMAEPGAVDEFVAAMMSKSLTQVQTEASQLYREMVDDGLLGMELMVSLLPPGELNTAPMVIVSSDKSLIYEWQVPDYIVEALEAGDSYIYSEDGIPELGLEGEQLILLSVSPGSTPLWFMAVRPMAGDVAEINAFFEDEKNRANLVLALVIGISVIVIIIITFFVLSYLIRKQITDPIDELSAAAEQVMEGDLEVEIAVREGEEFEGLKRVFRDMVDSIKRMIERSMEG